MEISLDIFWIQHASHYQPLQLFLVFEICEAKIAIGHNDNENTSIEFV
jgi:hypothetical protein